MREVLEVQVSVLGRYMGEREREREREIK